MSDPVLDTLLLPIESGAIVVPTTGRMLFLRARVGAALSRFVPERLVCEQTFKPEAALLDRAGFVERACDGERFGLVLILPPRSREEARALFAQAVERAADGATVVASVANNQGARSLQDDLERLVGSVSVESKNKCRVFWCVIDPATIDQSLLADWRALDAPRPVRDSSLLARAGLFSADAIDVASRLLAEHLPSGLFGRAADLGAGYGYLARELLARNPGLHAIDLYEAEARALDVACLNLASLQDRVEIGCHWLDVTRGLPQRYDVIVSNPPFHEGRADVPDLGRAFIIAAAQALNPGGCLWLVANRHLPYEAVLAAQFPHVRVVVVREGFKVIEAHK